MTSHRRRSDRDMTTTEGWTEEEIGAFERRVDEAVEEQIHQNRMSFVERCCISAMGNPGLVSALRADQTVTLARALFTEMMRVNDAFSKLHKDFYDGMIIEENRRRDHNQTCKACADLPREATPIPTVPPAESN
jgi:hypothetical protein